MNAYTNFAEVYDTFMDNVPYQEWADYIQEVLLREGISKGLVLELGCGTGSMAELLAHQGYDMIGLDNSQDMLEIAMNKRQISGYDILYLRQDMREFELYGTVQAIISVCDSINYVLDTGELSEVFSLVNNYLDPDGIFFFDFYTRYHYQELIGNRIIAETREECSFIWDNFFDEADNINEYNLTIFAQSKEFPALYEKYQEEHYQRAYTLKEIEVLLEQAGLQFVEAYDSYTKAKPCKESARICVLAKEKGKGSKG